MPEGKPSRAYIDPALVSRSAEWEKNPEAPSYQQVAGIFAKAQLVHTWGGRVPYGEILRPGAIGVDVPGGVTGEESV